MEARAKAGTARLGLLLCVVVAMLMLAAPSAASADLSFCPEGSGAGQCAAPADPVSSVRGLAVDQETGRLYVADEENNRVDVFKDDGSFLFAFGFGVADGTTNAPQTCTTTCFKGIAGTGAGQLDRPRSVAVDNDPASPSQHAIYVADRGNFRVQKFDSAGVFVWMVGQGVDKTDSSDLCTKAEAHTCGAGAESQAEGAFASAPFVGVGPGGVLYALDNWSVPGGNIRKQHLQRFGPSGAVIPTQTILFEGDTALARALAVDASGNAWVSSQEEGLRKYSPAGTLLAGPIDAAIGFRLDSLGFDAAGTLYAGQSESNAKHFGSFNVISTYDSSGNVLRRFAYSKTFNDSRSINGLAAHSSAFGDVFFSQLHGGITYVSVPPPGPVIAAPSVEAISVGNARATLYAEVNPEGKASEVHFEYLSQKAYEEQGNSFTGLKTKSSEPVSLGAAGFSLKASEVLAGCAEATKALIEEGKCLRPETEYRFRVVATNVDGKGNSPIEGEPFTTKAPLEFGDTYATGVGTDAATLHAEVNPLGIPTEAHFKYVDDATFQESGFAEAIELPNVGEGAAPLDYGSGETLTVRAATAYPLAPATTYRYRLIATDPLLAAPLSGPERTFTTAQPAQAQSCPENEASRIGPGGLLPDCRAYEMVSPLDKGGGDIRVLPTSTGNLAVLEQSSLSGEKLAYGSVRAFGDATSAPWTSQYIAERIAGSEWRTHSISPPRGRTIFPVVNQTISEFEAFSADLCDGWLASFAEPPLAPGALAGYSNLYRRTDQLCGESGKAGFEALAPIFKPASLSGEHFVMQLLGLSADGQHAAFLANDKIAPEGSAEVEQLYLSTGAAPPRFVCILPDRTPRSQACTAGSAKGSFDPGAQTGRISNDGSRVFWSDSRSGEGKLYVRQNPDQPESARLFGAATGTGTLIGPAAGTGNLVAGSELVKNVKPTSGEFAVGQEISSANGGIPAKAMIVKIEETAPGVFTLTLSAKVSAGKTKIGDALTGAASATVPGLIIESGAFEAGQEISAPAIPPGTTVLSCSPSCGPAATSLTLSAKATKTETEAKLSATSPCTEAKTKACTIPVSKAAEEAAGPSQSWFWGAAQDGSKAIFTTGNLGNGAKLFSFDVEGEATSLIAEGVLGVMGISEDATRVYFASSKVLSGEANSNGDKAQAGKANLYLHEADGSIEFVAPLADADLEQAVLPVPYRKHTSLVSPNGDAAFISVAPLSGYDNANAKADATSCGATASLCPEAYRYDAATKQLTCVSCNPSGARPAGRSRIPYWETPIHAARVLSDDGARLYFESADALTPRDTNGAIDVYQWEAPGAGTCTEASPTYSLQNGGCVDLISTGQSHLDSRFVESDPSGENVFFATASSLLPQDPGGVDIYDARVGGGLPIPQGPPPGCEGEACQSPPEAPNDPTPASAAFEGAGNLHEEAPAARTPCAKGKVHRKGRCVAVRHHKRAKRHPARGAHPNRGAGR